MCIYTGINTDGQSYARALSSDCALGTAIVVYRGQKYDASDNVNNSGLNYANCESPSTLLYTYTYILFSNQPPLSLSFSKTVPRRFIFAV